jgi:hypothetical protein
MRKLAIWFVAAAVMTAVGCHGEDEAADKPPLRPEQSRGTCRR